MNDTPLESYLIDSVPVVVKREDLCCPQPGPPFSKMRGVVAHIAKRSEPVIGVLDTYHSQAGWAVSYACRELGKQAINFWPKYREDRGMRPQQQHAQSLGAELVALPAARSAILYHSARKNLRDRAPISYMMPNALKMIESVTENAAEAKRTAPHLPGFGTVVISISSGTVAAGVIRGLAEANALGAYRIVLHMGYSRSEERTRAYIAKMSGVMCYPKIIDEGYGYGDAVDVDVPFPCNKFYDAKAWLWLTKNLTNVSPPIIFWSIGA